MIAHARPDQVTLHFLFLQSEPEWMRYPALVAGSDMVRLQALLKETGKLAKAKRKSADPLN